MRSGTVKTGFEILLNLLVAVAASFIIYSYISPRLNRPERRLEGTRLQSIEGINWGDHEQTLILALHKGCHFCEQSMPFYQRLNELNAALKTNIFITAIFPDDAEDVRKVMKTYHLEVPAIHDVLLSSLTVTGTPTLLLVSKAGIITKAWEGSLTNAREAEVLNVIRKAI